MARESERSFGSTRRCAWCGAPLSCAAAARRACGAPCPRCQKRTDRDAHATLPEGLREGARRPEAAPKKRTPGR